MTQHQELAQARMTIYLRDRSPVDDPATPVDVISLRRARRLRRALGTSATCWIAYFEEDGLPEAA